MNLVIDVETTKFPKALPWIEDSYLVSIHIATTEGSRSWLFNHPESTQSQKEIIQEVQDEVDRSKRIIGHNLKFDLHWLRHIGICFDGVLLYDTLVAEYVIRNFHKLEGLSLDDLCTYYGIPSKIDKVKLHWDSGYETDQIPADILIPYGEQDCVSTLQVYNKQISQIENPKYLSLEMEVIRDLQEAEYNGMLLDTRLLEMYQRDYDEQIRQLDLEMRALVGDINIDSGQQLSAALYGGTYEIDGIETVERTLKGGKVKEYERKCKVPITIPGLGFTPLPDTETKKCGVYKTDSQTISQLKATTQNGKKFLALYQERAKMATLNKTFFTGLLNRVTEKGYVHPTVNQTVTRTSRLSCSNPNLQNLPRGSTGPVKKGIRSRYEP